MALAIAIAFALVATQDDGLEKTRNELGNTLKHAIVLLEAKKYEEFVERFVPPEQLARVSVKEFAKMFAERRAKGALAALKAARRITPAISGNTKTATYTLDPPVAARTKLVLRRIGDRWYFAS